MTVNPLRISISIFLWLVVMLGITGFYLWSWLQTPHHIPREAQELVVVRGDSLTGVGHRLHDADIIRWPDVWAYYARLFEPEPIKAGEYKLPDQASPLDILRQLQVGEVVTYPVTFVEGRTFADILEVLHKLPNIEHKLAGLTREEIMTALDLDIEHPEGWFFPDTYHYIAGDSDVSILRHAYRRMSRLLALEWRARAVGLPYKNSYEALIMASIVEKETGVAHERDEIAGVFVRRLKKGMRLQTDPTVIYGLGLKYDGNLQRSDLTAPTPYNTYTNHGLPPTPIALPGRETIHAALHPKEGDALYFVARGDGSHYFSATLDEHVDAVRRYQKSGRREDYRSSPPSTAPLPGSSSEEPVDSPVEEGADEP